MVLNLHLIGQKSSDCALIGYYNVAGVPCTNCKLSKRKSVVLLHLTCPLLVNGACSDRNIIYVLFPALFLAYTNGAARLCRELLKAGGSLATINRHGVSIFNAQVPTKKLLYTLLGTYFLLFLPGLMDRRTRNGEEKTMPARNMFASREGRSVSWGSFSPSRSLFASCLTIYI